MRFGTESGAVYTYADGFLTREGNYSPGIDYATVPDGEALLVVHAGPVEVGRSAEFFLERGKFRITTPVVWIEGAP